MSSRLVRHSIRAMRRYKVRSAFIMLGSFVGAAALTLVVSMGGAAERKVLATVEQLFGASSILLMTGGSQLMSGARGDAARLTLDDVEAAVSELPQIVAWDPQQAIPNASVRAEGKSGTARVLGASERFEQVWNRGASRGASFDEADVASSARVAVIGETIAHELFGDADPLEAEILIGNVPFRVVGVLERFGTDLHGMDRDDEIVVPISTMMRRVMNVDNIAGAKLLVRDAAQVNDTAKAFERILRERHNLAAGRPNDFTMITATRVQKMMDKTRRTLGVYLPVAAGIVLLVAAIVAASLMLASVNERVSEIGLRRAVGAQVEQIQMQFVIETAATMLVGAIAGIIAGSIGAQIAADRLQLGDVLSWRAALLVLVVSAITGALAGVIPARRAAKLDPANALR